MTTGLCIATIRRGTVFEIERVLDIDKGYVVLQVFPPEDSESVAARKRTGGARVKGADTGLDRLVLAYESINCIHFAPVARHQERAAGF